MIALKTILLPTDGSECSGNALKYALSFAKQYGARVVALHVIDQHWVEEVRRTLLAAGDAAVQSILKGHEEDARRIVQGVADAGKKAGVPVEAKLVTGVPFEDIVRVGKELSADLIIIGTHGRRGMSHLLMGSVAERVVRQAPCPVLTVRQAERDFVAP